MRRRSRWFWGFVAFYGVVLTGFCCVTPAVIAFDNRVRCPARVERESRAVFKGPKHLDRELAPLGEVAQVHWIQDPLGTCEWIPVPGVYEIDRQGVVQLTPAAASALRQRYAESWEAAPVPEVDARLAAWLPSGAWMASAELNLGFGPKSTDWEQGWYAFDAEHGVVVFSSTIHGSTAGS